MSNELREFLQAWLDWALASEVTVVKSQYFEPNFGLCICSIKYAMVHGEDVGYLEDELKWLFRADNLHRIYPFGMDEYIKGASEENQHLCTLRLAWVKGKLNG